MPRFRLPLAVCLLAGACAQAPRPQARIEQLNLNAITSANLGAESSPAASASAATQRRDVPPRAATTVAATPMAATTVAATHSAERQPRASTENTDQPPSHETNPQRAAVPASAWCTDSVKTLDEETCYVLPERPTGELLIYLHGLVPVGRSSAQLVHFEQVVAAACQRAGVAALLPRGVRNTRGKYAATWGWPSGAAYLRELPSLVKRFQRNHAQLETLVGLKFSTVYVAGSSAGAYFVTSLATRGDYSAAGFAALSGAGSQLPARLTQLPPKPFYIGYGRFDPAGAEARALERRLHGAGWPVRLSAQDTGHGAREIYLDEAFEFWRQTLR